MSEIAALFKLSHHLLYAFRFCILDEWLDEGDDLLEPCSLERANVCLELRDGSGFFSAGLRITASRLGNGARARFKRWSSVRFSAAVEPCW